MAKASTSSAAGIAIICITVVFFVAAGSCDGGGCGGDGSRIKPMALMVAKRKVRMISSAALVSSCKARAHITPLPMTMAVQPIHVVLTLD